MSGRWYKIAKTMREDKEKRIEKKKVEAGGIVFQDPLLQFNLKMNEKMNEKMRTVGDKKDINGVDVQFGASEAPRTSAGAGCQDCR